MGGVEAEEEEKRGEEKRGSGEERRGMEEKDREGRNITEKIKGNSMSVCRG